jgi:hypothetical protein
MAMAVACGCPEGCSRAKIPKSGCAASSQIKTQKFSGCGGVATLKAIFFYIGCQPQKSFYLKVQFFLFGFSLVA